MRIIRMGAFYIIPGPAAAFAFNATEFAEGYVAIGQCCFGDNKFGFLAVPRSYFDGTLCVAMLSTCPCAASQGFGNTRTDAACFALIRTLSERHSA